MTDRHCMQSTKHTWMKHTFLLLHSKTSPQTRGPGALECWAVPLATPCIPNVKFKMAIHYNKIMFNHSHSNYKTHKAIKPGSIIYNQVIHQQWGFFQEHRSCRARQACVCALYPQHYYHDYGSLMMVTMITDTVKSWRPGLGFHALEGVCVLSYVLYRGDSRPSRRALRDHSNTTHRGCSRKIAQPTILLYSNTTWNQLLYTVHSCVCMYAN